ncbi:MAG: hypothetical protein L0J11_08675, partial [Micrococcaceae bacterium]|nr:hypothetical protein [Micrococcaceae bacterium]
MSNTKVEIRITKIHCGNTEDVTGPDELYFTSMLTDGSAEKTQAEVVGIISINDNQHKYPNALIYSDILANDRSIRGGVVAFDEDSSKDWANKPKWIEKLKDGVIKGLKASGHPVAVSGGEILDWGYKIADAIIKADKDDKLGEKELEVSASGPETEKITWHFSKKGDWFGYSSWNYTGDFEIVRTPVSTADETSNT